MPIIMSGYYRLYRDLVILLWLMLSCLASARDAFASNDKFKYPFYAGITGGYGKTTWEGLVSPIETENPALLMSTPKYVNEGGIAGGVFAGYELTPYFAIETAYMRYPDARVVFDPSSLFSFEHNGDTEFTTRTETVSLIGKIMLLIPRDVRVYSGLGISEVHRSDYINDHWSANPTFAAGVNYLYSEHIMTELGANYTTGRGKAELSPAENYFPFLYSIFFRLAYRF